MKKLPLSLAFAVGLLGLSSSSYAVEYTRICSNMAPGFYALPGFEADEAHICMNPVTGETLQSVPITPSQSVIWKSLLPYSDGSWVSDPRDACGQGRMVKLGSFKSTDFSLNAFHKLQSPPSTAQLQSSEMITKVVMQGGFYDPRVPARTGTNGAFMGGGPGLCVRSTDSKVLETQASGPALNPPYGDAGLPIGCIADRRIANMPLAYVVSATAAYPSIDAYFVNGNNQPPTAGPYVYGKQLVVTTDIGPGGPAELHYCDPTFGSCGGGVYDPIHLTYSPLGPGLRPMAGTLAVWACLGGGNGNGSSQ